MRHASKLSLAVLVSGRGSNLQSIIDACRIDNFPAQISVVISNKSDAYAIERAKQAGIPTVIIPNKDFASREAFEEELLTVIERYAIHLVCLAGFMRVLTPTFITPWSGRLINIHPSLLPKHKGLHTHERAIEAGDLTSGCTIHYVTPDVDDGEIILQRSVPILPDDTPNTLAARVLIEEHIAYPEAIRIMANKLL